MNFGSDLVIQDEEKMRQIQANMKAAQSRQISYTNKRRRPLELEKGDHVFLRVFPNKGISRFGIKGKLAPRYIGPFPITEKYSTVAYRLQLPDYLACVHNVFHVSQLKKCLKPPIDVLISDTG